MVESGSTQAETQGNTLRQSQERARVAAARLREIHPDSTERRGIFPEPPRLGEDSVRSENPPTLREGFDEKLIQFLRTQAQDPEGALALLEELTPLATEIQNHLQEDSAEHTLEDLLRLRNFYRAALRFRESRRLSNTDASRREISSLHASLSRTEAALHTLRDYLRSTVSDHPFLVNGEVQPRRVLSAEVRLQNSLLAARISMELVHDSGMTLDLRNWESVYRQVSESLTPEARIAQETALLRAWSRVRDAVTGLVARDNASPPIPLRESEITQRLQALRDYILETVRHLDPSADEAEALSLFETRLNRAIDEFDASFLSELSPLAIRDFLQTARSALLLQEEIDALEGQERFFRQIQAGSLYAQLGLGANVDEALRGAEEFLRGLAAPQEQLQGLLTLAQLHQSAGNRDEADRLFTQIAFIGENSSDPDLQDQATFARAMRRLNEGDLAQAESILESIPDHPAAQGLLTRLQAGMRRQRLAEVMGHWQAAAAQYLREMRSRGDATHLDRVERDLQLAFEEASRRVLAGEAENFSDALWSLDQGEHQGFLDTTSARELAGLSDLSLSDAAYHREILSAGRRLLDEECYGLAGFLAQSIRDRPDVGTEARHLLNHELQEALSNQQLLEQAHQLTYFVPYVNIPVMMHDIIAGPEGELGESFLNVGLAIAGLGVAVRAGVAAEGLITASRYTRALSPSALQLTGWAARSGTEAAVFSGFNLTTGALRMGSAEHLTLGNFSREFGAMLVTFGLLRGVGMPMARLSGPAGLRLAQAEQALAQAERAGVGIEAAGARLRTARWMSRGWQAAHWGSRVSAFTASEYLNEGIGLREETSTSLGHRLISSALMDAEMIAARRVLNALSRGGLEANERANQERYAERALEAARPRINRILEDLQRNALIEAGDPLSHYVEAALRQSVAQTGNTRAAEVFSGREGRRALFAAAEALGLEPGSRSYEMVTTALMVQGLEGTQGPSGVLSNLQSLGRHLAENSAGIHALAETVVRSLGASVERDGTSMSEVRTRELRSRLVAQLADRVMRNRMGPEELAAIDRGIRSGEVQFFVQMDFVTGEFVWEFRRAEGRVEETIPSTVPELSAGEEIAVAEEGDTLQSRPHRPSSRRNRIRPLHPVASARPGMNRSVESAERPTTAARTFQGPYRLTTPRRGYSRRQESPPIHMDPGVLDFIRQNRREPFAPLASGLAMAAASRAQSAPPSELIRAAAGSDGGDRNAGGNPIVRSPEQERALQEALVAEASIGDEYSGVEFELSGVSYELEDLFPLLAPEDRLPLVMRIVARLGDELENVRDRALDVLVLLIPHMDTEHRLPTLQRMLEVSLSSPVWIGWNTRNFLPHLKPNDRFQFAQWVESKLGTENSRRVWRNAEFILRSLIPLLEIGERLNLLAETHSQNRGTDEWLKLVDMLIQAIDPETLATFAHERGDEALLGLSRYQADRIRGDYPVSEEEQIEAPGELTPLEARDVAVDILEMFLNEEDADERRLASLSLEDALVFYEFSNEDIVRLAMVLAVSFVEGNLDVHQDMALAIEKYLLPRMSLRYQSEIISIIRNGRASLTGIQESEHRPPGHSPLLRAAARLNIGSMSLSGMLTLQPISYNYSEHFYDSFELVRDYFEGHTFFLELRSESNNGEPIQARVSRGSVSGLAALNLKAGTTLYFMLPPARSDNLEQRLRTAIESLIEWQPFLNPRAQQVFRDYLRTSTPSPELLSQVIRNYRYPVTDAAGNPLGDLMFAEEPLEAEFEIASVEEGQRRIELRNLNPEVASQGPSLTVLTPRGIRHPFQVGDRVQFQPEGSREDPPTDPNGGGSSPGPLAALLAAGAGAATLLGSEVAHALTGPIADAGGISSWLISAALGLGLMAMTLGRNRPGPEGEIGETLSNPEEPLPNLGDLQDLETTQIPLQERLAVVEQEVTRLTERLDSLSGRIEAEALAGYRREVAELTRRAEFWLEQQVLLESEPSGLRGRFARDIEIGQGLLLDRTLRLMALIFAEPLAAGGLSGRGLREPWRISPPRSGFDPERPPPAPGALPALVNRDVGFGRRLGLRPHQEQALNAIRGWLASQRDRVESGEAVSPDFLQATILMPVGGGKTRTMVAAFAETMRQGLFDARRGDRLLLLNHTTQIHEQNREVLAGLEHYFQRTFGRSLRVSEYKAEQRDLSGDVVVVSIPTVNNEARRESFARELREALGPSGRIAMVAVDEVHHLELGRSAGRGSWTQLLETLREVSPNFFRLGFTATPTGREARVLYRLRESELMRAGVTPRTYLVKVDGVDLSQLRVSQSSGDFAATELATTLLEHPARNRRILEALEARGLRRETLGPGGSEQLEGTIFFAADLAHARMLAQAYQEHFESSATSPFPLRGRRILSLGLDRGRISASELQGALGAYRAGEIDAVTAVVSGQTRIRDEILRSVEAGEIEAVFTVDALVEGADLFMFRNQVGARPTFSRIKRVQERGRINRRGPGETDAQGRLLHDPPRILFDVIDRYVSTERVLVRYGDAMGLRGHVALPNGELYDALSESVVAEVDRSGSNALRLEAQDRALTRLQAAPQALADADSSWAPLIEILREILEGQYQGDLEQMAMDLGESPDFVTALLEGRGWENNQWFLRRLSTLLYLERNHLLEAHQLHYEQRDSSISIADLQILRGALQTYEAWEGSLIPGTGIRFSGDFPWGTREVEMSAQSLARLQSGRLSEAAWRGLWQGLSSYFWLRAENEAPARSMEARIQSQALMDHLFARNAWEMNPQDPREQLRLSARRAVAGVFGGVMPRDLDMDGVSLQGSRGILTRWLAGNEVVFKSNLTPQSFYSQVRALLTGLGIEQEIVEAQIQAAIFAEQGWSTVAMTPQEELRLLARRAVAGAFGGVLLQNPRIDGVPSQESRATLTRWLAGDEIDFNTGLSAQSFYSQVRALLMGLGIEQETVEAHIQDAVFAEQGWITLATTPQEQLRLLARRAVATAFGGVLPHDLGIDGVSRQDSRAPLRRWLAGEEIVFTSGYFPQSFYSQVRALLTGLGIESETLEAQIQAAVFAEQGWNPLATTPQEELRLLARRAVATAFGGVLPRDLGIDGVSFQGSRGTLTRWLAGNEVVFKSNLTPQSFYSQVRALLTGLGARQETVETQIQAAVFAERGWSTVATTPQEQLRLLARRAVAGTFGGVLAQDTGIEGVPVQQKISSLARWLAGDQIVFSHRLPAQSFYSQVKVLLTGLGIEQETVDAQIQAAVFAERGWNTVAATPQEQLRLLARRAVVEAFGGVLPHNSGIDGVPQQTSRAILTQWLAGEELVFSNRHNRQAFYSQVRAILTHQRFLSEAEADRLIQAAIAEDRDDPNGDGIPPGPLAALFAAGAGSATLLGTEVAHAFAGSVADGGGIGSCLISAALGLGALAMARSRGSSGAGPYRAAERYSDLAEQILAQIETIGQAIPRIRELGDLRPAALREAAERIRADEVTVVLTNQRQPLSLALRNLHEAIRHFEGTPDEVAAVSRAFRQIAYFCLTIRPPGWKEGNLDPYFSRLSVHSQLEETLITLAHLREALPEGHAERWEIQWLIQQLKRTSEEWSGARLMMTGTLLFTACILAFSPPETTNVEAMVVAGMGIAAALSGTVKLGLLLRNAGREGLALALDRFLEPIRQERPPELPPRRSTGEDPIPPIPPNANSESSGGEVPRSILSAREPDHPEETPSAAVQAPVQIRVELEEEIPQTPSDPVEEIPAEPETERRRRHRGHGDSGSNPPPRP